MKSILSVFILTVLVQFQLYSQCGLGETEIIIEVDGSAGQYNSEVYWRLYDNNTDTLVTETFPGFLGAGAVQIDSLCLKDGVSYRFEAYDDFGDGWNDAVFNILYNDNFVLSNGMPNNGENPEGNGDLEETVIFTVGDKPGDDCSLSKEITTGETVAVNTSVYTNNYESDPLFDSGREAIFSFTPLTTEQYAISFADIASLDRGSLQLFDNCYDSTPNRIAFDSTGVGNNLLEIFENLNAGTTYYIVVSNNAFDTGIDNISGNLSVTYSGSPVNTSCANAYSLTLDGDSTYSRTVSNSPAQNPVLTVQTEYGDMYSSDGDSLFYDFTLASLEDIVIEVGDFDLFHPLFIELEKKENCGEEPEASFKRVALEDVEKVFAFSNLASGTYRLKIFPPAFIADEFFVSVKTKSSQVAAANQDCASALNLDVVGFNESLGGSSITTIPYFNSTDSGIGAPCGQDSIYAVGTGDVWVKAQVPNSGDLVIQTFGELSDAFSSPDQTLETRFSIYTGNCGSLTEFYCSDKWVPHQQDTVNGLPQGEEIFVRLWSRNTENSGLINIRLTEPQPLPFPQTSIEHFTDSLHVTFTNPSGDDEFFYEVLISADSFNTFLPGFNPANISSYAGGFGVPALQPATTYYFKIFSKNGVLANSDTTVFEVETSPYFINTVADGDWSNPAVWSSGTVPAADSAVNIYHQISINQGENFDVKDIRVVGGFEEQSNVGLWINNGILNVEDDIRVEHLSGVPTDSVGVFMVSEAGNSSVLNVGREISFELADGVNDEPIQFYAINNGDSLRINVGNDFLFEQSFSDSTQLYDTPNIDFQNVDLNLGGRLFLSNDNFNSIQPFNGIINNSRIKADIFELNAIENTNGKFQVNFTGSTDVEVNFFKRSGNGGKIKFADQSTLRYTGSGYQEITSFGDFQDSIIYNNVFVNIEEEPNSDSQFPELEILKSYEESFSKVYIEGELSLVQGLLIADNDIFSFGYEEVVFGENATVTGVKANSYVNGIISKIGNTPFTFPVGNDFGPRQIRILNNEEFQISDLVRINPVDNFCGITDSLLTTASLARERTKEYWEVTAMLSDNNVAATFEAIVSDPVKEGITDFTSLEMVNFKDGTSLGNGFNTDSSFQSGSEYNFSVADTARIGLASNILGENPFYFTRTLTGLSQPFAAAGENITLNLSGPFASSSDQVYIGGKLANLVSNTSNSLTVTVPEGTRSGSIEVIYGGDKILYGSDQFTLSYLNPITVLAENYANTTVLDSISGNILLGESRMQLSQIDGDSDFEAMIVSADYEAVTVVDNLSAAASSQEFFLNSEGVTLNPTDFKLQISNIDGDIGIDALFDIEYNGVGGIIYFRNDGNGNFTPFGDGSADTETIYNDYLVYDTDSDGSTDALFSVFDLSSSSSLLSGEGGGALDCSPFAKTILPFLEPAAREFNQLLRGNYINNGSTDISYLNSNESSIGLIDLYNTDTISYVTSARTSDQIFEVKNISLFNNGFEQIVASNQNTDEIEIYSFNNGSELLEVSTVPLSFTPAKIKAEDINGDGFQDLIVSNQNAASLHILLNDGTGQLSEDLSFPYAGGIIADFDVLDLNNDGIKDFLILQEGGQLSAAYYELDQSVVAPEVSVSNISTSSFDLVWDSVQNAVEYEVFISLENDTIADLATDSTFILSDTALSFAAPNPFETYYVFGRSISTAGDTSNYSTSLAVNLLTLDSMNLQAQNISTSGFDLEWSSIDNASEYEVFISLENDTIADLATDSTFILSDTALSFAAPNPFETYYVFGRSISTAGDTSNYSTSLAVNLLTLDSMNLQAQNISTSGFDLEWSSIDNASEYEVFISMENDTVADLATDSTFILGDTALSFAAPNPFDTYYVFGRSISAAGDVSTFSNSIEVQLDSLATPDTPEISNVSSIKFDLSWSAVEGADQYQVYIGKDVTTSVIGESDSLFLVSSENVSYIVPEYSDLYFYSIRAIANSGDTSTFSVTENIKLPISTYLEQDSLAMVALYQNTNGQNWVNSENWLTGKLNTWEGLFMINDSLKSINLPSNQIEGTLPNEIGSLNFVNEVSFAQNDLAEISALEPLISSINNLDVSGNALNFEQLQAFNTIDNFTYGNQDFNYPLPSEYLEFLNADISIDVNATASSNTFQWYKDNVLLSGETGAQLIINNLERADEGLYYVEVRNSLLGDLTLTSTVTELKVSSLERDVQALRQFYESTNGDDWSTISWDTTSNDPREWSSNNQDIVVEDDRVVEINLPDNNLTGSVPEVLNEVLGLRSIDISSNAIEELPNLTSLPNLSSLNVSGNALDFLDLEPNVSVEGFEFSDQANFGTESSQRLPQGSGYELNYDVLGSNNTYEWYNNNVLLATTDSAYLSVDSLTFDNMGDYRVEVSNAVVNSVNPTFRLVSNTVELIPTSNISGTVQDANDFLTESGRVYLFKYREDQEFDTLRFENGELFVNVNPDGSFELENVELDDYLIHVNNDGENYPDLLNTYFPNTIDWELAEVVALRENLAGLEIIMEGEPQELTGTSSFSGYLDEEYEEGERVLARRRVSGAGVSVRRLSASTRNLSIMDVILNGELVAYLETDENGEFEIPNLPAGNYTVKFDIPGVPMNEDSDINFDFTGEDQEALEISAVIDGGQISVNRVKYTANKSELMKNVSVYPNPSNGEFNIVGSERIANIKIISTEGRLIQEITDFHSISDEVKLDISNYPNGMYFLQIIWNDGLRSMNKLIKE